MRALAVVIPLVLFLVPSFASAQAPCDARCDHVIDPSERRIEGAAIAPGETVCVRGGVTATLAITDVHGDVDAPVEIRACDAPLVIGEGSATNGISIVRSSHLRVTGGAERAIRIVGGPSYSVGVAVGTCTDHLEVDGLEVSGTSYTAYRNLSEDDACPVRDGFSLHDWFIHDVGGEGMFFGANAASTPYRLTGVEVWGNRIERTGMQGIKIGMSVDTALVHDNVVIEPGTRAIAGEDTGITGGARTWRIERNVVARSAASCAFVSGAEVTVANNLFLGCGGAAISMNGAAPLRARVVHNTIVAPGGPILNMWASMPEGCALGNNLFVDVPDEGAIGVRPSAAWTVEGNLALTTDAASFVTSVSIDADYEALAAHPFAIELGSPATDAGLDAFAADVHDDITGALRDPRPDVGAHEARRPSPDAGPSDAAVASDAGVGPGDVAVDRDAATVGGDAGAGAARGGCTIGRGRACVWPMLLLIALAAHRRSRAARPRAR